LGDNAAIARKASKQEDVGMTTFNHISGLPRLRPFGITLVTFGLLALATSLEAAGSMTLSEAGSTLFYPLFQLWIPDYARVAPGISLTAAPTGSGAGVDAVISGIARIGASDAYMSDEQIRKNRGILNIAVAISAQTVNYNVPGLNNANLKLDGPTLAGIYMGKVTMWDAPAITALNPGTQLPHQPIVPIRRADASGDTFIFTQFLDFSTETWSYKIGYGTSVAWPDVAGEKTADSNDGMVQALVSTPHSVGYIGISFGDAIAKAGLGTALLKNQSGKFLLATAETITKGASELDPRTPPDQRLTLVFAPGDLSYPLVNYEYMVVAAKQPDPETAAAVRRFLLWAISSEGGNSPKYLDSVGFIPLPNFIRALSENQINLIR
jgi:phosphate transport system substrate-binding protein